MRKVFNPKKFDKNYVLIVDPFFGKEITMRFAIYGLPLLIGFIIASFAIFGNSIYQMGSDPLNAINGVVNFLILGFFVPISIYFLMFLRGKDDRYMKDIFKGKVKYNRNRCIMNERTYLAEKERD